MLDGPPSVADRRSAAGIRMTAVGDFLHMGFARQVRADIIGKTSAGTDDNSETGVVICVPDLRRTSTVVDVFEGIVIHVYWCTLYLYTTTGETGQQCVQ